MNAQKLYAVAAEIARVNPHVSDYALAKALGLSLAEGRDLLWQLEDAGLAEPDVADSLTRRWVRAVDTTDAAAVRQCLEAGFQVNTPIISRHAEPLLPLLYVCPWCTEPQELEILRLLLSAGADPNLSDADGDTALMYVTPPTAVRLLLATPSTMSTTPTPPSSSATARHPPPTPCPISSPANSPIAKEKRKF